MRPVFWSAVWKVQNFCQGRGWPTLHGSGQHTRLCSAEARFAGASAHFVRQLANFYRRASSQFRRAASDFARRRRDFDRAAANFFWRRLTLPAEM